jgi:hypothetical protein
MLQECWLLLFSTQVQDSQTAVPFSRTGLQLALTAAPHAKAGSRLHWLVGWVPQSQPLRWAAYHRTVTEACPPKALGCELWVIFLASTVHKAGGPGWECVCRTAKQLNSGHAVSYGVLLH